MCNVLSERLIKSGNSLHFPQFLLGRDFYLVISQFTIVPILLRCFARDAIGSQGEPPHGRRQSPFDARQQLDAPFQKTLSLGCCTDIDR